VLLEAEGQLGDMRVMRLGLAFRLSGSPGPRGPSLRDHAQARSFLLPVISLGTGECLLGCLE
jgi:hypothetical protein